MRDASVTAGLSDQLLIWYDRHARVMPWRVSPSDRAAGLRPDPYRIWLSEVMLQQTTVAAVRGYFIGFTDRWPTVAALAGAVDAEVMAAWAGLGYYARARNLLACARAVVARHGSIFPADLTALQALPGIGPYTAAAIGSIAFDLPATVVDGNVERVMARLYQVETPLPTAKSELTLRASRLTPQVRAGDYAQAVMDLGATICTPRNPVCGMCPWMTTCRARLSGIAGELPRKLAKPVKPTRQGQVWLAAKADGSMLLERRAARGLLGGMLGLPGDGWDGAGGPAPAQADWVLAGEVRHTFTHFSLILAVWVAVLSPQTTPIRGEFLGANAFSRRDLPTVMRKAFDVASGAIRIHDARAELG